MQIRTMILTTVGVILVVALPGCQRRGPDAMPANSVSAPKGDIVFVSTRDGLREIYLMKADGSEQRRLTETGEAEDDVEDVGATTPAWSPDGSLVAYSRNTGGSYHICVIDREGVDLRTLTGGTTDDHDPTWSPDGRRIAFSRRLSDTEAHICVMSSEGEGSRRITSGPVLDTSPDWSPDGTQIVFVRKTGGTGNLWLTSADGTNVRPLTKHPPQPQGLPGGLSAFDPAWSPNGTTIVFAEAIMGDLRDHWLAAVGADGSGYRRLLDPEGVDMMGDPAWSPDGQRIAFVQITDRADIYVLDTATAKVTRLTEVSSANDEGGYNENAYPFFLHENGLRGLSAPEPCVERR